MEFSAENVMTLIYIMLGVITVVMLALVILTVVVALINGKSIPREIVENALNTFMPVGRDWADRTTSPHDDATLEGLNVGIREILQMDNASLEGIVSAIQKGIQEYADALEREHSDATPLTARLTKATKARPEG